MITRNEYINGLASHHAYYIQFATARIFDNVTEYIGIEKLIASKDQEFFNDLNIRQFEVCGIATDIKQVREAGEFDSLSLQVCVAKAAARALVALHRDRKFTLESYL